MSCHAAMCASPSRSLSTAHREVRIASPEAETEREADRIADAVLSRSGAASPSAQGKPGVIHRQCVACATGGPSCANCAGEETLHLARGAAAPAATTGRASQAAAAALSGGGRPLPEGLRSYFEPRIAADLSSVRLHTDAPVGRAAQGIDARAYTVGRDIGFAPGAYAPDTAAGQRLLAHEIAHTLQGEGTLLHRQPDEEAEEVPEIPSVRTDTHEDSSGGGGTSFEEIVETRPTVEGDRIRGPVRRREIAPASDDEPRQVVADHRAQVEFDTAACEVVLPYRFGFEELEESPNDNFCQGARMEGTVNLDAIAQTYIDTVNAELNDQFEVRISGCESDCADRNIPIRIEARRDDSDPDRMIRVIPRAGRGASSILCAGQTNPGFPVHEAGHQILGRGDEYPERDPDILEDSPHWGRPERVRHDYSWMASSHHFGRFAVFHQRDFRHVQTFLRVALPGCQAELVGVPQVTVGFRPFLHAGVGVLSGTAAGRVGGGFDLGIPLTRGREWSLLLGAQADYLAQLDEDRRRFVLAGMRVGFERQFQGREVSGRLFGTGRFGVSRELETTGVGSAPGFEPRTSAFGEGEIGAGVLLHGSEGRAFTADLRLGGGGELASDEAAARWFNVGVSIGGRF